MRLSELETQLAAAKAARDNERVRALIPAVNAARREFREFAEAFAEQCERQGIDLDGNRRTPDQRLTDAIFGAEKASKDALARLQARWESGEATLEPEPEPEPEEAVSYKELAEDVDDDGRWAVDIWASQERVRFSTAATAWAFAQALPVHAEVHDFSRTAVLSGLPTGSAAILDPGGRLSELRPPPTKTRWLC